MMDNKLLACPRCGGRANIQPRTDNDFVPCCMECPIILKPLVPFKTLEEATTAWNTRPTPTPEALSLEQLKYADNMPVWTVTKGVEGSGKWELISWHTIRVSPYLAVLKCVNLLDGESEYPLDTYGKTWFAYTTKPAKEGEG